MEGQKDLGGVNSLDDRGADVGNLPAGAHHLAAGGDPHHSHGVKGSESSVASLHGSGPGVH